MIFYTCRKLGDPLDAQEVFKLMDVHLRKASLPSGNRNYLLWEGYHGRNDPEGMISVEVNKYYITVSWTNIIPREIVEGIKFIYPIYPDEPPIRAETLFLKTDKLFWNDNEMAPLCKQPELENHTRKYVKPQALPKGKGQILVNEDLI